MIYFRDSLDRYQPWLVAKTMPAPPRRVPAKGSVPKVAGGPLRRFRAHLSDQTITAVTLTYQMGSATRLQQITIGRPERFKKMEPTRNIVGLPDADTIILYQPRPRVLRFRRDPAQVLARLTLGWTEDEVVAFLTGIDPGHHAVIQAILKNLLRLARMHWLRDLDGDTSTPCRPTLTLDRDRTEMPNPDPDQILHDRFAITADIVAIRRLSTNVANAIAIDEAMVGKRTMARQQTAWPIDLVGQAFTDSRSGRGWSKDDQGGRHVHRRPGNTGQVSLGDDAALPEYALAAMRDASLKTGNQGMALLHTLLTLARDAFGSANGGVVTIVLDEIAISLFGRSRGPVEAAERRAALWEQVRFIANLRVEGPGPRMKIRQDNQWVDMAWFHPLIVIEGVLAGASGPVTLEGLHQAPAVIEFRASDRFARDARLGNRAMPVLGVLGRVIGIASGNPSGSWAQAIVYALLLEARKRSCATVEVTRDYLLSHYPGKPHPMELISDPNTSHRAVAYWAGAMEKIKRNLDGLIEKIEDPKAPTGRGWAARWLKQRVVIRLGLDIPETAGLRELTEGRARHATKAANRLDRDTIRADTIRRRKTKTVLPV